MLPMLCPRCRHDRHRAAITNGKPEDQIVRRRVCEACGHSWFTVEAQVSPYAIGWCSAHASKPVLRVPVTLELGYEEIGEPGPKPKKRPDEEPLQQG